MSDKKIQWTKQQADAIKERGRDVLVTASAGTGKTAVLSGRCADIVADKNICPDIWNILVVTFTDAAAEQMRRRIADQLNKAYADSKDIHLKRQLVMLAGADISTIHSFCKRLITENFHAIGIDPTFGIIDGDEQNLIKAQVLEQTVEWAWEQANLTGPLRELLQHRNINYQSGILNSIIEISNFLEGVIDRDRWCEKAIDAGYRDFALQRQKETAQQKLDQAVKQLIQIESFALKQGVDEKWQKFMQEKCIEPIESITLDKLFDYKKPRMVSPKGLSDAIAELLKDSVKEAVEQIVDIKAMAVFNPEYVEKISKSASKQAMVLIEMVKKFDEIYGKTKQALNRLDFADLERLALRILAKDISSGEIEPSDTAIMLRQKYRHIFVDEYQDINQVQKAIIDLLSCDGNVFVVGDIKQSIYAFRGAEPGIFADDLKSSSDDPKDKQQSRRIDLNLNFRSNKGILDFVNHVFSRLMSESVAGIEYDDNASLKAGLGSDAKDSDGPAVELHLLESEKRSEQQDVEDISARQRQAAAISKRISEMVGVERIYDNELGESRPISYSDIVILMRSPTNRANHYVEILRMAEIPVSSESAAGYFETTEISDCLCLLKVLDNPQRDIELAAVLRSPLFNITETELAKIRLFSKDSDISFYDCVKAYAGSGSDEKLAKKLTGILNDIDNWRRIAVEGGIADLLWQIYRETNMLAFVSALPNGKGRKANLLKLHDRAIQFENFAISGGASSLNRFVWFVEKLQEQGGEWTTAEPEGTAQDAVRIMSIHKSKGLEFNVVFLAETEGLFNTKDTTKDILLSNDLPVGLKVIDKDAKVKLSTTTHQVLADEKLKTNLAEEMRILYVALTRAKQKLILTGSIKNKKLRQILMKGRCFKDPTINSMNLCRCRSFIEWIVYGLADTKALHEKAETGFESELSDRDLFSFNYYTDNELAAVSDHVQALRKSHRTAKKKSKKVKPQPELLEKVKKALSYKYQYQDQTKSAAKQSVTQLTHFSDEFINIDYSRSMQRVPVAVQCDESDVQSRVIGTATHLVISKIDLDNTINVDSVSKVIDELIADGSIDKQTAEKINVDSIVSFFESDIGKAALNKSNKVHREWPFTYALSAEEAGQGDTIVVQGIIDMLIETAGGIIIVDFKTDRITAGQVTQRVEKYTQQLNYYAQATQAILDKPIASKWLYFLNISQSVKIL